MQLATLPVKRIVPSPDNPRTINEKEERFRELVTSVGAVGVQQPLQVRIHPTRKDKYDLLAGHRRLRAAQLSKLTAVPVLDYGSMADDEAFKIAFIENAHREDLTPLEQGKAAATALARCKGDAKAAGAILGRSERWVHLRAGVHESLCNSWRKTAAEPRFKEWTAAHLARIARFPANVQEALLKKTNKGWVWTHCQDWTVAELDKHCAEELMLLAKAPFDTTPTSKCAKCAKRTSCQPLLWDEPKTIPGPIKATVTVKPGDRCLDRTCWDKREASACKRLVAAKKSKYEGLLCVSNLACYNEDRAKLKRCYGPFLSQGKFTISKKTAKGAKPALVIAGRDKGKVRYVKIKQTKPLTAARAKKPTAKERAAQVERNRWVEVAGTFHDRLTQIPYAEIPGAKVAAVCLVAAFAGAQPIYDRKAQAEFRKAIEKAQAKGPTNVLDVLLEQLWAGATENLGYSHCTGDEQHRENMALVARTFKIDLQAIYNEIVAEEKAAEASKSEGKKQGRAA